MSPYLVIVRGYWGVCTTTFLIGLASLTLVLTLCSTASTVMAHEKEGFIVLPNQAPRFSGPVGGEEDITEILATREQTGGRLECGGTRRAWRVDHPCTSTARRMSSSTS